MIYNIEKRINDGGKFVRSGGTYAVVLIHKDSTTVVQLPSGKVMEIDSRARATVGIVAGGGRIEKPMLKAGVKYYRSLAKSWKYPTVRGKAMNPYAHPHGGGSHQKGETPVPRTAPPGQKVGIIAPGALAGGVRSSCPGVRGFGQVAIQRRRDSGIRGLVQCRLSDSVLTLTH